MRRDRLPELRQRIEQLARETLAPEDCIPRLALDADVRLAECDFELIEWLERLSPHGLDNPEPVLCARGLTVTGMGTVGAGKHLRLQVRDASDSAEAIGFGMGARAAELTRGGNVDLAFVPTRNEWMGQARVQLKLKGMRPA